MKEHCAELGVPFALNNAWAEGGDGAVELANLVVETIEKNPSGPLQFTYKDEQCITEKIEIIAKNLYEELVSRGISAFYSNIHCNNSAYGFS